MIVDWQLRNAWWFALLLALVSVPAAASTLNDPSATSFIKTSGTNFALNGRPFFVAGVNNHYLTYGSHDEAIRVQNRIAINGGVNSMRKVDFLIAEAGKRQLRLIIAVVDFWTLTGGAQQMRGWFASSDESTSLFGDPRTKRDHRTWVSHVVQRINSLNGLAFGNSGSSSREKS